MVNGAPPPDQRALLTIIATYRDPAALLNVVDELINRGIPREQIEWRKEGRQVRVTIPAACEPEVNEVLVRHRPATFAGSSGRIVGGFEASQMPRRSRAAMTASPSPCRRRRARQGTGDA